MQLAEMQKYYREVEALFPHQLQAVIFDQRGPHLALADAPGLPTSDPIFLRICQRRGCQKFITFSGQQIDVNGEKCDVLADAKGNVIITGQKLAWSSADRTRRNSSYQIQAHLLEGAL
jgi:hypothetical protein